MELVLGFTVDELAILEDALSAKIDAVEEQKSRTWEIGDLSRNRVIRAVCASHEAMLQRRVMELWDLRMKLKAQRKEQAI